MPKKFIDFRSDTVTQPCEKMRKLMANAAVGDDVYGDDPTVNRLEEVAAEITGHEAALFCSSGTQTNLLALMTHCKRGEEYIVGGDAHTYKYEAGGAAVLGSIQPQPIEFEEDGTLDLEKVVGKIKEDDFHFARTRLLALENTKAGRVIPQAYLKKAQTVAAAHGLILHLDGARVANAAVAQHISIAEIASQFDSISLCLSKGLGAPVGSIVSGKKDFIAEARRTRKMLGGGMRQAGVIAAAAMYALENNVERLREDHENASYFANCLKAFCSADLVVADVQTNMVFVQLPTATLIALNAYLRQRDVIFVNSTPDANPDANIPKRRLETTRLVMHKDISREDIDRVVEMIAYFLDQKAVAS